VSGTDKTLAIIAIAFFACVTITSVVRAIASHMGKVRMLETVANSHLSPDERINVMAAMTGLDVVRRKEED
jgi:hypothetical protein